MSTPGVFCSAGAGSADFIRLPAPASRVRSSFRKAMSKKHGVEARA